ncbi:MAG: ComEC/Rec2 family competence protein [Deltaproteobacteria bacterium]
MKPHYYPPLIPVVLAYASGILMQMRWHIPAGALGVLAALGIAGAGACLKKTSATALILAVFLCAGALRYEEASRLPPRHIAHATPRKGRWIDAEGVVVSSPRRASLFTGYILRLERVHPRKGAAVAVCGDVAVRDYLKTYPEAGERLRLKGKLYRPSGLFARLLAQRRIYSLVSVGRGGRVVREGPGTGFWSPLAARGRLVRIFARHFDPETASLLRAMMLGEKELVPRRVREAMIAAGTWHLMVVSGFHTAFLAGLVLLFLKVGRVPGNVRLVLGMAAVGGYCLVTGAAVSVVRAALMTCALMYTFLRRRHPLVWVAVAWAAFMLLVMDPTALASVSFQLSFASVMAILALLPRFDPVPWLGRRWRPSHPLFRILRPPLTCAAVSLSAWLGTLPLVAASFGAVSLYGMAANILAVPLAMGVIGSGFLVLCCAPFNGSLAAASAAACAFLLELQVAWSAWIAGWPLARLRLALPAAGAAASYAVMILGLLALARREQGRDNKACRR